MNHLAHFFLAWDDPDLLVGGLLGDYIKGRLKGEYGAAIEAGIKLHRSIDAFTDKHEVTRLSQSHFDPKFRRVSGIMTDIIYDHFLARNWHTYHDMGLQKFSDCTFNILLERKEHLTEPALKTCERMYASNTLTKYYDEGFIDRSLKYLSTRLSRANPLSEGFEQFLNNKEALDADFRVFFPELIKFVDQWKSINVPKYITES
ncbi:MAG: ACP phosphodiesterase [Pseudomonadales bacterium]|jgi:acyl carrier protein phosphodiesterase